MIGLRIGVTCRSNVTDLHAQAGYELLTVLGKGSKPALIPLPVPVLRAVREAIGDRQAGPLLLNTRGGRLSPSSAANRLQTPARRAGLSRSFSPHILRRTFCTAGLLINVRLRDMQLAMRYAGSRTTLLYDVARANLDRHAAHTVAAYLAGMSANWSRRRAALEQVTVAAELGVPARTPAVKRAGVTGEDAGGEESQRYRRRRPAARGPGDGLRRSRRVGIT